jgi:type III secretion protein D
MMNLPAPRASTGQGLLVSILSGLHAGVSPHAVDAQCRIGSNPECDIALLDAGVHACHVRITRAGRTVVVEAIDGVAVVEGAHLPVGRGLRARLPLDMRIGPVRLLLHTDTAHRNGPLSPFPGSRRPWHAAALSVALVVLVATLATSLDEAGATARSDAMPAASSAPTAPHEDPAAVEAALHAQLDHAGLDRLQVVRGDNLLGVSGSLDQPALSRLRSVEQWFDSTYGRAYVLRDTTRIAEPAAQPQLTIRAVWQGPQPYIVDRDGQRRYPGAVLDDGWVLARIETGRILLERGGEQFSLVL